MGKDVLKDVFLDSNFFQSSNKIIFQLSKQLSIFQLLPLMLSWLRNEK